MGWPQPKTPIQCKNPTAVGVANKTIIPHKTKSMDMNFHWLRCRESQRQFWFLWDAGKLNLGDYSTKITPPCTTFPIGTQMRASNSTCSLQGCDVTPVTTYRWNLPQWAQAPHPVSVPPMIRRKFTTYFLPLSCSSLKVPLVKYFYATCLNNAGSTFQTTYDFFNVYVKFSAKSR